jgi:hypothetical protein
METKTYKGVFWRKISNKWEAKICHKGRQIYVGLFSTPLAAHQAYETKLRLLGIKKL